MSSPILTALCLFVVCLAYRAHRAFRWRCTKGCTAADVGRLAAERLAVMRGGDMLKIELNEDPALQLALIKRRDTGGRMQDIMLVFVEAALESDRFDKAEEAVRSCGIPLAVTHQLMPTRAARVLKAFIYGEGPLLATATERLIDGIARVLYGPDTRFSVITRGRPDHAIVSRLANQPA